MRPNLVFPAFRQSKGTAMLVEVSIGKMKRRRVRRNFSTEINQEVVTAIEQGDTSLPKDRRDKNPTG